MAFSIPTLGLPTLPPGGFKPAPGAPPPAAPQESYAGTMLAPSAGPLMLKTYQDMLARQQLIGQMVDSRGVGVPSPAESTALTNSLSKVDTNVLRLAQSGGTTFGVVRPGQPISDYGVQRPHQLENLQGQIPQLRAQADRVAQLSAPFDAKLEPLRAQREALGPQMPVFSPFGGAPAELTDAQKKAQALDQQIAALQKEKGQALKDSFPEGSGVVPFLMPSSARGAANPQAAMMTAQLAAMPKGTAAMAKMSGAKTPEETKAYEQLMEGINGDRLTQARQASLEGMRKSGIFSADQLKQFAAEPGSIPIDADRYNILTPNLFFGPDGKGGRQSLDFQGIQTQVDWADENGKTLPSYSDDKDKGTPVNGEEYNWNHRIIMQSGHLSRAPGEVDSNTPIHELGHALDSIVKQRDPEWYGPWSSRLQSAYDAAKGPPWEPGKPIQAGAGSVTSYALTNTGEYLAEGVANYYDDPKRLKAKDPALFALTEEFLARANQLGGR